MPTIIGFGSLLSETSARSTFGNDVSNFRLGRVENYRRVFAHPASIFFERGIAKMNTLEIASLSTEQANGCSFQVSIFELPEHQMSNFFQREEEFKIKDVPYIDKYSNETTGNIQTAKMCTRWNDQAYIEHYGQNVFQERYGKYGLNTIWGWKEDSGILPCRIYLRHCILSVKKLGQEIYDDFVDNTFLSDRVTTIRQHLQQNPSILSEEPPEHLIGRYSG